MSYSYQPEQPRDSGSLYPGWTSTVQYTTYTTPMERDTSQWSNSTGTSNQATWSPKSEERGYILGTSPATPSSAGNSPGYYSEDTQATATATGISEGDWSVYYNLVVPKDHRKESYWQLQDQYAPTESMPERRPVERKKKSGHEVYPCTYPGCTNSKPFKRTADLQRHYTQLHAPPNPSLKFHCDYPRCLRAKEPLGRKDHYRDHLRDYHGEDLVKRAKDSSSGRRRGTGKSGSGKGSGRDGHMSSSSRVNVSEKWWRCTKCLERKMVCDGWFCHGCKRECEEERIENRTRHLQQNSQISNANSSNYNNSSNNPDDYSDNEDDEAEDEIKTEIPLASTSPSASRYRTQSQTSSTPSRSAISQTSNICIYGCNNSWILNSMNAWEACPNCQGLIGTAGAGDMTSIDDGVPDNVDPGNGNGISTYQVSYTTSSANSTSASANVPLNINTTSSSAWQPSIASEYSSHSNTPTSNPSTSTILASTSTSTPVTEEYKTNCGNCSNYMVWDGRIWSECPVCWAQEVQAGGETASASGSRRSGRSDREKEKEKKKSKRSSGWFR